MKLTISQAMDVEAKIAQTLTGWQGTIANDVGLSSRPSSYADSQRGDGEPYLSINIFADVPAERGRRASEALARLDVLERCEAIRYRFRAALAKARAPQINQLVGELTRLKAFIARLEPFCREPRSRLDDVTLARRVEVLRSKFEALPGHSGAEYIHVPAFTAEDVKQLSRRHYEARREEAALKAKLKLLNAEVHLEVADEDINFLREQQIITL